MVTTRLMVQFAASLAMMVALLACAAAAQAVVPGQNDRLAWARVSVDGTQQHIVAAPCAERLGCGAPAITTGAWDDQPAWNPVRAQLAFRRTPVCEESSCSEIWLTNADRTSQQPLTSNDGGGGTETASGSPSWAPSGDELAFWTDRGGADEIWVMNADGTNQHPITTGGCDLDPDWSPDGAKILFQTCRDGNDEIYVMNADGSGQTRLTVDGATDGAPAWSPDGHRIAFVSNRAGNPDIWIMKSDGSGQARLTTEPTPDLSPAWSPDGTQIAFTGIRSWLGSDTEVFTMLPDGTDQNHFSGNNSVAETTPDWGPKLPRGYARPRSASPVRASLVPAYSQCTAPDRTHGPPLAFPSCGSPGQTSPYLTVGTPDSNGAPPKSASSVKFRVAVGAPGPPHDTQVLVNIDITDVRCTPAAQPCGPANDQGGADYTGELEGEVTLRLTDKDNVVAPGAAKESATMTDYLLRLPLSCAATADTTVGSICSRTTSLVNFGVQGIVPEGTRAIWELGSVRFDDGGADGVVSTSDNTPFLTQGVFIP